jgi:hypothetical protein
MTRILVCGGRYVGRVPSTCPPEQINARIVRASEEQKLLSAGLNEIHSKSKIEMLLHFNQRGAQRLSAHWASISAISVKSLQPSGSKATPVLGLEACRALLRTERIDLVLRFPGDGLDGSDEFEAAAKSLGVEVRHVDPAHMSSMSV